MFTLSTFLAAAAIVCFCLDAFHVSTPRVSWTPLGFALVTAAVFLA